MDKCHAHQCFSIDCDGCDICRDNVRGLGTNVTPITVIVKHWWAWHLSLTLIQKHYSLPSQSMLQHWLWWVWHLSRQCSRQGNLKNRQPASVLYPRAVLCAEVFDSTVGRDGCFDFPWHWPLIVEQMTVCVCVRQITVCVKVYRSVLLTGRRRQPACSNSGIAFSSSSPSNCRDRHSGHSSEGGWFSTTLQLILVECCSNIDHMSTVTLTVTLFMLTTTVALSMLAITVTFFSYDCDIVCVSYNCDIVYVSYNCDIVYVSYDCDIVYVSYDSIS